VIWRSRAATGMRGEQTAVQLYIGHVTNELQTFTVPEYMGDNCRRADSGAMYIYNTVVYIMM